MADKVEARVWLRKNGYEDIADKIDSIMLSWKKQGKRTRRNWWDVLAGDKFGRSRTISGYEFPVLKVAQERQQVPITPNAVSRSMKEECQSKWEVARWKPQGETNDASE